MPQQDYLRTALCFFADDGMFKGCVMRDDGKYDYAHAIPAQRLRCAGVENWKDPRVLFLACRRHHHAFDMKMIQLREDEYPDHVKAYAKEIGFRFVDGRTGWVQDAGC